MSRYTKTMMDALADVYEKFDQEGILLKSKNGNRYCI